MDSPELRPLSARGRFFIITPDGVQVQLITDTRLEAYYQGLAVAADTADPVENEQKVRDETFRARVVLALPAPGLEALLWLLDQYDGPHAKTVHMYAAALMYGLPLHGDNWGGDIEGGTKVPVAPPPGDKPRPGGAVFEEVKEKAYAT